MIALHTSRRPAGVFSVLAASLSLGTCSESWRANCETITPERVITSPHEPTDLTRSNHAFAVEFFHAAGGEAGSNFAFSPVSLRMAFALAHAGARGETRKELETVMQLSPDEAAGLQAGMAAWLQHIETASRQARGGGDKDADEESNFEYAIANSIWADQTLPLHQPFVSQVAESLQAVVHNVDFRGDPDAAVERVHDWVEETTHGHIREILSDGSVTSRTRAILANALMFRARWGVEFSKLATRDREFLVAGGEPVTRPFMHKVSVLRHVKRAGVELVSVPFTMNKLAMSIFLPDETLALQEFEAGMTAESLSDNLAALAAAASTRVMLALPKFDLDACVDATRALSAMGLRRTFSDRAEFDGMSPEALAFSAVAHRARVEVDEAGVIASAATAVALRVGAAAQPPKTYEFVVDRPFLFVIHDSKTGHVLFMGRCAQP